MKIGNTEIKVVQGDITELKVDAIVNAANNKLVMGGGVAGAIKRIGGKSIEDEAVKLGPIKIGEAVVTGAGNLPAKYIIHAATMGMDFKTDEIKIRDSAMNALRLAEDKKIKSIAFCALGCGVGGFPLLASAKIMAQEVFRHLREEKSGLKEIIFCLFDKEAKYEFDKGVIKYLEHMGEKICSGPFITVDIIIQIKNGIVLIERSNPPFGWALPGGFVDYGESLEHAAAREAKEETGLDVLGLEQFHTYSKPGRDPRFHTISTVFLAKAEGKPRAGDDAAALEIVKLTEIDKINLAFDHRDILKHYSQHRSGEKPDF